MSTTKLLQILSLYGAGDPKVMAGGISAMIIDFAIGAAVGLVGVFIAWIVLRNKKDRPSWFLPVSTFFAWTWIIFIPIGTVVGFSMLKWRKREEKTEKTGNAGA